MDPARIASLLVPFLAPDSFSGGALTGQQLDQVSAYLDLLIKWNARINLSSVRQPAEIITRHFGESFFAARHLGLAEGQGSSLIDLGSGAGFPGLAIKLYAPSLSVTLVESNQKKATFLHEVIRRLTLTDIDVFAGRAEDFRAAAGIVTLRAVEKPERALPAAARLVAAGGRLALLLGDPQAAEVPRLLAGFAWGSAVALPGSAARVLLVGVSNM
jgi:16S rRNA (guanine527-N7)-methyltransferase